MFLVSLGEIQATDIMTYYTIIKRLDMQLQRESEIKDRGQFFSSHEINDHQIITGNNSRYEVLIN